MRSMENMNPSPSSSPHQPATEKEGAPFAQATVQISKQEHIQLKWGNRYWHRQHGRALERIAALEQELERAQAKIRDLTQRLYGKHSEKGGSPSEAQADGSTKPPPRSRGQTRGSKVHGRDLSPPPVGLFEPLTAALLEKHLTDRLFHGDETRWQVFQVIEGKIGYRWSLWLTCSASVVYFGMAPGRGAKVIKEHRAGLPPDVPIIFVCDRYRAYPCWAKDFPLIRLAFCWAHVRRDFLDAAKAWPLLAVRMHSWVESIGELYHLNDQRLAVWDKNLPLAEQSLLFQVRHQALADGLAAMSTKRDPALADPDLHSAQKKVLASLNLTN